MSFGTFHIFSSPTTKAVNNSYINMKLLNNMEKFLWAHGGH